MGHFMSSKLLALTVLILIIAACVSVGCALLPFWFRLHFSAEDATYGSMGAREADLEIGIFYIFKPNKPGPQRTRVLMTSLLAMDKAANLPVVPPMFRTAQIFYTIGVFGTAVAMAGAFILACREFGSLTGNLGLAFFGLIAGVCQCLGVLFAIFTVADSESTWHMLPLEDPFRIVITSHPTMYVDWGFYIAVIGAALALVGGILSVIEALKVCKSIEGIRRQQRRSKAPEEPYPDIRYQRFNYADVPRPRPEHLQYEQQHQHSHSTPGMIFNQPAHTTPGMVFSQGPPQQFIAQPQPSPQPPRYPGYQPETSPDISQEYNPPPGGYVSRQVDL